MPSEQPAPLHACAGQLCCGLAGLIGDSSRCYVTVVVFRKKKKKLAALKEQIQMGECEVPERTMA